VIPQAAPLYGYAWQDSVSKDGDPDQIMVIGWEPSTDGDFTEYYPVVAWLNSTSCGTAFVLGEDWTWTLIPGFPEEGEGAQFKAQWHRESAELRAFLAAERQKREATK
jgi:hypothetical protein